ncbi:MAG TPA: DUF1836 domain-containing protein [Acholeplasmataceae bacterium]|nr:DUF1836 domain-containing protein [Acholeplasmataceae bacterium]
MDWKEEVRELAKTMSVPDQIKVEDIPKVNLYMEQLLSFLNENLQFFKRYPEDQMLTKAMINNYSKNEISPPPQKKLYRKLHIMAYALIYQFKQLISLNDMKHITAKIAHTAELEQTYRVFLKEQKRAFSKLPELAEEVIKKAEELDVKDQKLILPLLLAQTLAKAQAEILFSQRLIDLLGK